MIESLTLFIYKKHAEIGEFILSLFMMSWGLWLLNPMWDTFSLPSFASFLLIANETTWGLTALTIGGLTFIFAGLRWYWARRTMIFLNIVWWTFVAMMFLIAVPENTAVPVYMMLAVLSFWRYIKLVLIMQMEKRFYEKPENEKRLVPR